MTKVSKNCDKKKGGGRVGDFFVLMYLIKMPLSCIFLYTFAYLLN